MVANLRLVGGLRNDGRIIMRSQWDNYEMQQDKEKSSARELRNVCLLIQLFVRNNVRF